MKKPKPDPVVEPEPVADPKPEQEAEPIVEGITTVPIEPEPPKKDVKLLELVKCDKCNRKMTERTLKYAHAEKCPAIHPPEPRIRKSKIQQEEPPEPDPTYEEAPALAALKRDTASIRRERINQKKEQHKALVVNAFPPGM